MSLSGTIETCQRTLRMSVDRGRLEEGQNGAFDPGPWYAAAGTIKSPGLVRRLSKAASLSRRR
jgi:hypothetical protein